MGLEKMAADEREERRDKGGTMTVEENEREKPQSVKFRGCAYGSGTNGRPKRRIEGGNPCSNGQGSLFNFPFFPPQRPQSDMGVPSDEP